MRPLGLTQLLPAIGFLACSAHAPARPPSTAAQPPGSVPSAPPDQQAQPFSWETPHPPIDLPADAGDNEAINRRRWSFAAFFNRVKSTVRAQWHPDEPWLKVARDKRPAVAGLTTRLEVVLDREGNLLRVAVHQSCGVAALDDAALEAFKAAAPFAKPPGPLVNDHGTVEFRFGFYYDTTGRAPPLHPEALNSVNSSVPGNP